MPANLPPNYYAAERRYRVATEAREKVQILREMLAIMPKHKGTDHLQGDLKKRIAKFQHLAQKKQTPHQGDTADHIPREGAGQVVLVGPPNSGKSTLISTLTHIQSPIADYPCSTFKPYVGMMPFEDVQIQLVDLPPLDASHTESWIYNIIRLADLVLVTVEGPSPMYEGQIHRMVSMLREHNIELVSRGDRRPKGPIAHKSTRIILMKSDKEFSAEQPVKLSPEAASLYGCHFSILDDKSMAILKKLTFEALDILRIYTKVPGRKPDFTKPFILERGQTVEDAARLIHHSLFESMTYARLWTTPDGQGRRVEKQHRLEDGDILEIHLR